MLESEGINYERSAGLGTMSHSESASPVDDMFSQKHHDYYGRLHATFGNRPEALGITKSKGPLRYKKLVQGAKLAGASVLDVGCGFADLYGYLIQCGYKDFQYTGIEVVPEFAEESRRRYPAIASAIVDGNFLTHDFSGTFDYVVASGAFSLNVGRDESAVLQDLEASLQKMFALSTRFVAVDFLTNQVDYRDDHLVYFSPALLLTLCQDLTRRFTLEQDTFPFEFLLRLYRDDSYTKEFTTFLGERNNGD